MTTRPPLHRPAATVEWLTPPSIIAALGPFDLDPCAPAVQPYQTAARVFTAADNGLIQDWRRDRVWLNPPYGQWVIPKWLARMAEHDRGTALIFARTGTAAFHRFVWERASALLFMRGRIKFHLPDGTVALKEADAPTVLCAYGAEDMDVLAGCEIEGRFIPLRIQRSVLVQMFERSTEDATWAGVIRAFYRRCGDGPLALDELYRYVRVHPKAARNRDPDAKVRQVVQEERYERVAPGVWRPGPN